MFSPMKKRSLKEEVTIKKVSHERYSYRLYYKDGDKRKSEYFKKKTGRGGADERKAELEKNRKNHGTKEEMLSPDEREAVMEFRRITTKLPPSSPNYTLKDVIASFKTQLDTMHVSMTFGEAAEATYNMIEKKSQKRANPQRHLDSIKREHEKLNKVWRDVEISAITSREIEHYIENLETVCRKILKDGEKHKPKPLSASSQNKVRGTIFQIFKMAVKKKAIMKDRNPMDDVDLAEVIEADVEILSPREAAAIMEAVDTEAEPALAIALFAGLRRSEILRLEWSDIKLKSGYIQIRATKAKKTAARNIKISDNLHQWLQQHAKIRGLIVDSRVGYTSYEQRDNNPAEERQAGQIYDGFIKRARKKAAIARWPFNAARRSFGSYHLEMHEDKAKTQLYLGHTNPATFDKHYKNTSFTKEDAETYWSIAPVEAEKITNIKAQ